MLKCIDGGDIPKGFPNAEVIISVISINSLISGGISSSSSLSSSAADSYGTFGLEIV